MILMEAGLNPGITPFYSVILHGNSVEEMEFVQLAFLYLLLLCHQSNREIKYFWMLQKTRGQSNDEKSSDCNCEEITKSFTDRFLSSANNNECHVEDVVPDFALRLVPDFIPKKVKCSVL